MMPVTMMAASLFLAVGDHPPVANKATTGTEAHIRNALHENTMTGFAGTLTFDKEMFRDGDADGEQERISFQRWSITMDGQGSLRATISWPEQQESVTEVFGRTPTQSWMLINDELLILDNQASPDESAEIVEVGVLRIFLASADYHYNRLLLSQSSDNATPSELLLLDRDPEHPCVVVKQNGRTRHITYDHYGQQLVASRVVCSDDLMTYRWDYSDYHAVGEGVAPAIADFRQICDAYPGRSSRSHYSKIKLSAAVGGPGSQEIRESVDVPRPGDPGKQRIVIVKTVSDDGVTYDTGPFLNE